jgi:hypothetical protein
VGWGDDGCGENVRVIQPMYNISLFGIVTMNPPCTMNISLKMERMILLNY